MICWQSTGYINRIFQKKKIDQYANELQTWVKANEDRKKYKGNLKYIKIYILKLKFKNFLYKFLGM